MIAATVCVSFGFFAVLGATILAGAVGANVENGNHDTARVGIFMVAALALSGMVLIYIGGTL